MPLSLRPEPLLECSDISEISIYVLPEQWADMSEWPTSSVECDGELMPVYQRCHKLRLQTLEALHKTFSRYGIGSTWSNPHRKNLEMDIAELVMFGSAVD